MKKKIRILNELISSEQVDIEDFYCVNLNGSGISLQGNNENGLVDKYHEKGFLDIPAAQYKELVKLVDGINITIVLT